jgi:hypothetical protein
MTDRSSKLKEFARGKQCTMRLHCCNDDPATTVLAHLPYGRRGMGHKTDDWHSVHACSACHDVLDGRTALVGVTRSDVLVDALRAHYETTRARIAAGIITVK